MNMLFLEVDASDRAMVLARFPDAAIVDTPLNGADLIKACSGKNVVSTFIYSQFTKEIITSLPDLKLLLTRSVGTNHIDLDACAKQGIVVCHVPDYGSHVIAEHAFALLLGTLRHIEEGNREVKAGHFDYHGLRGMSLFGKTLGIVGTGKIGRKVAKIGHGFGMKLLGSDQCRVLELTEFYGLTYTELPELLAESDVITLHVPATPDTTHMINAETISHMKDGVILVNTARGELIDSQALLQALESGKIRYALLDVLEHERDFLWNEKLLKHPNVIVTPHIAFYSDDSMKNMYLDCFMSIDQWQRGEKPVHTVSTSNVVCDLKPIKKI